MGHQIIKCPDGTLAVFSDGVDSWVLTHATPEELLDHYVGRAAEGAREATQKILDAVLADNPREVYHQFTLTFDEADAASAKSGGESLK